jgi:putative DNA primase/helicase
MVKLSDKLAKKKGGSQAVPPGPEALAAQAAPIGPPPPGPIAMVSAAIDAADELAGIHVAGDDPHRLARLHLRLDHHHPARPTLVDQGEEFLAWDGRCWHDVTADVSQALVRTARAEFERQNRLALKAYYALPAQDRKMKPSPTVRKTDARLIGNVRLALGALVGVPAGQERPSWLGDEGPFPAPEILAFPNALVHLPGFAAGQDDCCIDPTPRFFSTRCLPFAFDPMAPDPVQWLEFLGQILGDDQQAKDLLQEWFGYVLTGDTSQQKIAMVVGPTRSGKGTIGRVLAGLLGPESVAGPSLSGLATNFGAESLIGRTLAVVGDARLSGRSDQGIIIERLLSISGEDRITVDRKHRAAWQGTLPTRLMLLSNELPELRDAAMALANRLLIIELKTSFLGREDKELTDKLLGERPGILLWAVEGWKRLRGRGHFVSPESSQGVMTTMKNLSSPVSAFLEEYCVVDPQRRVSTERLYKAFTLWCHKQGKKQPPDKIRFGKDFHAVAPGVESKRLRLERKAKKTACYVGIGLRPGVLPSGDNLDS